MELTKELAHELFYEENGILYWKPKNQKVKGAKRFNTRYANKEAGGFDRKGYKRVKCNQENKSIGVHRVIFLMHHGYLTEVIDHINGNITDNRIENLRAASYQTNNQNSRIARHNTSGIKGVSWHKQNKSWRCSLWTNNKSKEVGGFETKELAEEFMQLWREMAHGEFANHGKTPYPTDSYYLYCTR
jgi:hypothetical protein